MRLNSAPTSASSASPPGTSRAGDLPPTMVLVAAASARIGSAMVCSTRRASHKPNSNAAADSVP